jgi:hypothetical protein
MRKIRSLLVLIANRSVGSAHATEISGIPEIADGDTVVISGTNLRLLRTRSYPAPADRGGLTETGHAPGKQVTGGDNDLRSITCG